LVELAVLDLLLVTLAEPSSLHDRRARRTLVGPVGWRTVSGRVPVEAYMRRPVVFLLVPIVLPLAVACSDSSGPDTQTCTLATNSSTFGNVTIDVKYQAIGAGDGHLSSVTYVTQTGNVTEPNPTLPWEKDITLTGGVQAQISGNGAVKTGGLTVQFLADAGPGNTDQQQSSCGSLANK
jgi:hypothetical protein